jgi:hypothetical protein
MKRIFGVIRKFREIQRDSEQTKMENIHHSKYVKFSIL